MAQKQNDKWRELQTLLRASEVNTMNGINDTQLERKIALLKDDIRREARWQQDERADVAQQNRAALVELMLTYDITIPAKEFANWRPTVRSKGGIAGLWDYVEILMTNGLLAYYLNGDEVIVGHIQKFDGEVKPLFSVQPAPTESRPRKKPEAKPHVPMTANAALDLIKQMTEGMKQ